jgi:hypothetical protein
VPLYSRVQFLEMGTTQHYKHGEAITAAGSRTRELSVTSSGATTDAASAGGRIRPSGQAATQGQQAGAEASAPAGWPAVGSTVHTLCTSNGSPYVNFQTRIMYGSYKLAQKMPGGEILAGFTRILHRTVDDELMEVRSGRAKSELHRKCFGFAH